MGYKEFAARFAALSNDLVNSLSPGLPLNQQARGAKKGLESLIREYEAKLVSEAKSEAFRTLPDDFETN